MDENFSVSCYADLPPQSRPEKKWFSVGKTEKKQIRHFGGLYANIQIYVVADVVA